MLAGAAGVVGDAQGEQADGAADVRAYAPAARFTFDGVTEEFNPTFDEREFVGRRLRDFVAGAENAH